MTKQVSSTVGFSGLDLQGFYDKTGLVHYTWLAPRAGRPSGPNSKFPGIAWISSKGRARLQNLTRIDPKTWLPGLVNLELLADFRSGSDQSYQSWLSGLLKQGPQDF